MTKRKLLHINEETASFKKPRTYFPDHRIMENIQKLTTISDKQLATLEAKNYCKNFTINNCALVVLCGILVSSGDYELFEQLFYNDSRKLLYIIIITWDPKHWSQVRFEIIREILRRDSSQSVRDGIVCNALRCGNTKLLEWMFNNQSLDNLQKMIGTSGNFDRHAMIHYYTTNR
jgi:hypothetical protein